MSEDLLSRLAKDLKPSGIRTLEALARNAPGLISLGPGQPDDTLFPVSDIVDTFLASPENPDRLRAALQYGPSQGHAALIALLVSHMQKQGVSCDASNILVTSGAQQAIDLVTQLLIDTGDVVLVQPNTYPGALQVFQARGATIRRLHDNDGAACEAAVPGASIGRAKLIYAMTDFVNPTGEVISVAARAALLGTARRLGALLIEDSPYRDLTFTDQALPPTLLEMDCANRSPDTGNTLFIGSFSKIIAPGLRVGWAVGPEPIISRLTLLRQGSDLQPSTLSQEIVAQLLAKGLAPHIKRARARYQGRRDALLAALDKHLFPYATWTIPEGGFFVWVKLKGDVDTYSLLQHAISNGIAYVHDAEFNHTNRISSDLRLSFSHASPESMDEAVARLANTIRKQSSAALKATTCPYGFYWKGNAGELLKNETIRAV